MPCWQPTPVLPQIAACRYATRGGDKVRLENRHGAVSTARQASGRAAMVISGFGFGGFFGLTGSFGLGGSFSQLASSAPQPSPGGGAGSSVQCEAPAGLRSVRAM